ncbi:MAG: hypothetical protein GFH27_549323n100 [Chloroflexi bacterium AL-W]|nr:hypothetical protein [Chloroflexi bacterium AL-N10]NOK77788.1 hypothetical protein [Chloroflexi bacterium AL-N5]NOK84797.1 hypothetical protein [Chloroflexi bacterium AL-W]NOK92404.1 hypothetical protein [Chloroflexi bacterium AL-N15]
MSVTLSIRSADNTDIARLVEMNKRLIEDEDSRNSLSFVELCQRMQRWLMEDWHIDC